MIDSITSIVRASLKPAAALAVIWGIARVLLFAQAVVMEARGF